MAPSPGTIFGCEEDLELENPNFKIRYDKSGRPLINSDLNISITHSNLWQLLFFQIQVKTGIDIELKDTKIISILKISFLNDI
jgi:phosphopantetheinyl transferase